MSNYTPNFRDSLCEGAGKCTNCNGWGFIVQHKFSAEKHKVACFKCRGKGTR